MSFFDSIGSFFSNEGSHMSNLLSSWGKSPGKTLGQFALGAQDPLGAKIWNGALGTHFTPSVGQFGGETDAQFEQSRKQGVDTGISQTLGKIANVVAATYGAYGASGGLGSAFGSAAGAGAGEGLGEGAAAAGEGGGAAAGAGGGDAAGLAAADSAAVDAEGASAGLTEGGGAASTSAGSGASSWLKYGETAAKVLGPTVLSSVLAPKPPKTKAPTAMPDPLAQQQAIQQKLIAQMARRGRASTILTNPASGGSLGG